MSKEELTVQPEESEEDVYYAEEHLISVNEVCKFAYREGLDYEDFAIEYANALDLLQTEIDEEIVHIEEGDTEAYITLEAIDHLVHSDAGISMKARNIFQQFYQVKTREIQ